MIHLAGTNIPTVIVQIGDSPRILAAGVAASLPARIDIKVAG
jgi:hypothetical protein